MNRKGILVVVSGFSGVGKGTLMKLLTERYGQYALSISATTRSPRAGEEDGREYFFRTREAFEELIANDQLVEYAEYLSYRRMQRHCLIVCGAGIRRPRRSSKSVLHVPRRSLRALSSMITLL